jgi:hypothetical protein
VCDDLVARDNQDARHPAPLQAAAQRDTGKVEKDRSDNTGVDEERIDGMKAPDGAALAQDLPERLEDGGNARECRRVEVRAPLGDFAKPDWWKVRPGLGFDRDGIDERAHFVGGRCARALRVADASGDGFEHVVEDLAVEGGLAAEVVVDHRLVDARGPRDAVDAGSGKAAGGKLGRGGGQQPLARRGAAFLLTPPPSRAALRAALPDRH